MKNGLIILLIPLFLLFTAGVSITSLYCQEKLCEIGFNVHPCCDDVNKGGCCETKSSFLKVADGFVKSHCDTLVKVLTFERLNYFHELLAQILPPESAVKQNVLAKYPGDCEDAEENKVTGFEGRKNGPHFFITPNSRSAFSAAL